jgi:hypothetical protein
VLRKISGLKEKEIIKDEENYILRSFMVFTIHQILLEL